MSLIDRSRPRSTLVRGRGHLSVERGLVHLPCPLGFLGRSSGLGKAWIVLVQVQRVTADTVNEAAEATNRNAEGYQRENGRGLDKVLIDKKADTTVKFVRAERERLVSKCAGYFWVTHAILHTTHSI